jgi:hypothetical protein
MTTEDEVVYGYLTVEQRPADVVTYPDGRIEVVAVGEGKAIAEAWNAATAATAEDARQQRQAALDDEVAARPEVSDADIERILAERMVSWEARLKESVEAPSAFGSPEGRRAAFLRRNPSPTLEDIREELSRRQAPPSRRVRAERRTSLALAEERPGHWWARLAGPASAFDRPFAAPGPLPGGDVAALLTEMARTGWDIVHVSEERAAHHEDDRSMTTCIGLNVLVRRTAGEAAPQ